MSEDVDTLLAIAEIAGVFVGFAALLTIVGRRTETIDRPREGFLLATIVLVSVVVIVAALVPVVLNRYGLSESVVWRASSGVLFVLNWVQILYVGRTTVSYRTAHSYQPVVSFTVWALEPLLQISLLICIVGAWKSLAPALYLTALAVALIQVSLMLAVLVIRLLTTDDA